jgi:hypothetical protein
VLSIIKKIHPVPTVLWGLFIFILCLLPSSFLPKSAWANWIGLDKWVHLWLYAFWIWIWSIAKNPNYSFFVFAALIGLGIEFLQEYLIPSRSGEWQDWVADILGLSLGVLLRLKAR